MIKKLIKWYAKHRDEIVTVIVLVALYFFFMYGMFEDMGIVWELIYS